MVYIINQFDPAQNVNSPATLIITPMTPRQARMTLESKSVDCIDCRLPLRMNLFMSLSLFNGNLIYNAILEPYKLQPGDCAVLVTPVRSPEDIQSDAAAEINRLTQWTYTLLEVK